MKGIAMLAVFACCSMVSAATPPPAELIGIWTSSDAEMRGEAIWKGSAIYLDTDGIGALAGGDGSDVLGVRFVVRSYDPVAHVLTIDLTEQGKVVMAGAALKYDGAAQTLAAPLGNNQIYHRRFQQMSALIRKSLGLEPKSP